MEAMGGNWAPLRQAIGPFREKREGGKTSSS